MRVFPRWQIQWQVLISCIGSYSSAYQLYLFTGFNSFPVHQSISLGIHCIDGCTSSYKLGACAAGLQPSPLSQHFFMRLISPFQMQPSIQPAFLHEQEHGFLVCADCVVYHKFGSSIIRKATSIASSSVSIAKWFIRYPGPCPTWL